MCNLFICKAQVWDNILKQIVDFYLADLWSKLWIGAEKVCTVGENIIATTKKLNNYVAIQSFNFSILQYHS